MEIKTQLWPVIAEMQEAAVRDRESRPSRNYLGMSEIGQRCSRKLWLNFRGYSEAPLEGQAAMIFSLGDRVEEEVIKWLTKAGYKIHDQQKEFSAINGFFRGHCDGIIEGISSNPHVLEVKSANKLRFKAFQEKGILAIAPEYWAQVQCYMGYGNFKRALIVVMCKDNCEIYTERIHFAESHFKKIEQKAKNIISSIFPPFHLPADSPECEYCKYYKTCNEPKTHVQRTRSCGTCIQIAPQENATILCGLHQKEITKWGMCCNQWKFAAYNDDRVPF